MSRTLSKLRNGGFVFLALAFAGAAVYMVSTGMEEAPPPQPHDMRVAASQWLDDRYVAGAEAWPVPGAPLGLSKDRAVMLVDSESGISGHDVRTGEELWSNTDVSCKDMDVIDGEGLCVPSGDVKTFTLAVVDVSTGSADLVDAGISGVLTGIVGTYEDAWIVEGIEHGERGTVLLSVNRDGAVNWQQQIDFLSPTCVVLDSRIGCDDLDSVVLFDAASGKRQSEVPGDRNVQWFRDAVMIDGVVHEFSGEVRDVRWFGPEARFPVFPGPREGAFYTVDEVVRNAHLLDASGKKLVAASWRNCPTPDDDDRTFDPNHDHERDAPPPCDQWLVKYTGDEFPIDPGETLAVSADGGLVMGRGWNTTEVVDKSGEVVVTAPGGAELVDGIIVKRGFEPMVLGPKGK